MMDYIRQLDDEQLQACGLDKATAQAGHLPWSSGDGYSYGGGATVTIGERVLLVGEGAGTMALARELARRWNRT